jgi:hypothetical protein
MQYLERRDVLLSGGAAAGLLLLQSHGRALAGQAGDQLILLRQKFWRVCIVIAFGALQHGQRGRVRAIAIISRMRMVAIEFGMCRSGRKGGASGSVTAGYDKLREQSGGTWC